MTVQEVTDCFKELAPLAYAEDFDNVGLLVGDNRNEVTGVLVALDTLESVVDEAIQKRCNLIISFHPIIFKGLKKLTGSSYVERTVIKAIRNNISIFAIHTALDNSVQGVNAIICDILGLKDKEILIPQSNTIRKLQTYVPTSQAAQLRRALFNVGAGRIGNYEDCSFNFEGTGTFKGNESSNPVFGKKGELHNEGETAISITFEKHLESKILKTLFEAHPYEEVAYEIFNLENTNQNIGMGMVGNLPKAMDTKSCLNFIKDKMKSSCLRYSSDLGKPIKRVAVLGGSGSFAIGAAKAAGADLFVTADLKYHDFFSAERDIVIADIGHYESEQFTKNYLAQYLSKKITSFAVILSDTNTNPVKYL